MNASEKSIHNAEHLDLLVIGTSHEISYKELIEELPFLNTMYLDGEDTPVEMIKNTFLALSPKRTLIYGELSKGSGKSSEANLTLINSLLEIKKPDQKILIAAYFEFSSALKHLKVHHLRLPSSSKNIMKKFDEAK